MVRKALQVGLLSVLAGIFLVALPVYAASVDDAQYIADIVVENTGGSTTNACTVCDINTDALIDDGYITSDLLNTAIQAPGGTDIAYMPGVGDDPWIILVPAIAASEQKSYLFYTGGPAMQDNLMYFPNTGGMTSDDAASLELGDNFEVEQMGYIDTSAGSDKNLVYKEDAFRIWVSGEGEISAWLEGSIEEEGELTIQPGSKDNYIEQNSSTANHGSLTNVEVRNRTSGNTERSLLEFDLSELPEGAEVISATLQLYYYQWVGTDPVGKTVWAYKLTRPNWEELQSTWNIYKTGSNWTTAGGDYVTSGPSGGSTTFPASYGWMSWDVQAIVEDAITSENPAEILVKFELENVEAASSSYARWYSKEYATSSLRPKLVIVATYIDYEEKTVTATGVSSGEHTVKVTADGTNFKIFIDGVEKDSVALEGYSILDNDNGWSFLTNGSVLYMDYHKITVDGTLKQHIVYERDTTFQDQTVYNNDATPTFITESTDPDVTATMSNFRPIEENELTGYTTEETAEIMTGTPDMPSEMYAEGETEHLPGAALVNRMLDVGGIPHDLFWIPLCFGIAAGSAVLTYRWVKSLLIISIIGGVAMLFFALTGVIPFWPFLIYAVLAGGILVAEKHLSW